MLTAYLQMIFMFVQHDLTIYKSYGNGNCFGYHLEPCSIEERPNSFYGWCSGRRRSSTVLTGLNVLTGTCTNTVFH